MQNIALRECAPGVMSEISLDTGSSQNVQLRLRSPGNEHSIVPVCT